MASKRIARSAVDWTKFEKLVPKPDVSEFQLFKNRSTGYASRVTALPDTLPSIDWAQYKRRTKAFTGVVEDFEKKYKSLTVPYPNAPTEAMNQIAKAEQEEILHQKKYGTGASEQIKKWEEEVKHLERIPPVAHMTRGEQVEHLPELVIDFRKQPSIFPHVEEVNDPTFVAKSKNYKVEFPEDH